MKRGKLENLYRDTKMDLVVEEREFDYDLNYFDIYVKGKYLGSVFPDDLDDMYACIIDLEDDPSNCLFWDGIHNIHFE